MSGQGDALRGQRVVAVLGTDVRLHVNATADLELSTSYLSLQIKPIALFMTAEIACVPQRS